MSASDTRETLLRVSGDSFVCGAISRDGRVVEVAPYLRAAARNAGWDGRTEMSLIRAVVRRGWRLRYLEVANG